MVVADRDKARGISEYRKQKSREAALAGQEFSRVAGRIGQEQIKAAGTKELNVILKGDVQGSVEVITDLLTKLSNEKVRLKLLRSRRGRDHRDRRPPRFRIECDRYWFPTFGRSARRRKSPSKKKWTSACTRSFTSCRTRIKRAMSGLLEPTIKETYRGPCRSAQRFPHPESGDCGGLQGKRWRLIKRDSEVRLLRDDVQVFRGKVGSLRPLQGC